MKKISLVLLALFLMACGKEQHDLTVKANIEGLKKGTLYLKKVEDTTLVIIDSLVVNGNTNIELHSDLDSPEVFYLYLDKNSAEKDRITFFADKGITEINTTLKNFAFEFEIKGSEQQKTLEEYQTVVDKINNRYLYNFKEQFEARKAGDTAKLNILIKESNNSLKRKYLYTVNFALNNKNSEVAPYLALTEIYNARIDYLDTINNSLTPKVKASKYGKELNTFINTIKSTETDN
jgi:succinate dehydrogenase flavin-adding protein (antitoxin of CptAB toxin-antitoxin module)